MMALVMGARSTQALARACELGVAMQLTNIARDVGEDARNGRLNLPRDWLAEAGIDADAWLQSPRFDTRIAAVIGRLLDEADSLYRRAEHGIAALPRDCRPAIRAARLVYAEIGEQLRREGLDSITRRTVVSQRRKLALMARATGAAFLPTGQADAVLQPLEAVHYLVEAAHRSSAPAPVTPSRPTEGRVAWMLELFERQHERRARV
jgi:phytoene synthase